ncbi:uncharacterized protein BDR25DRAFT_66148 [Lindgomyces ingoldianus]|uniref:Uncharacterized protein n=1 Tax=Lindgomyces ingoldianus TaxID=673940 RepID=A0ACB6RCK2_9PLEO|nr:uncharacterized protein BDR25DRAFT_66148 [Lindgomyces ingoldianus]KAF2476455.1 hypothetical protein BDR25DRAFT_66148 [Lindgomyces ingoldianus]
MLGYISSTRKKSCHACVKSKRRCDLGYPCCKRCFTKGLNCTYPNGSVNEAEVVVRQTTPDLIPLTNEGGLETSELPHNLAAIDPVLTSSSDSSSPESVQEEIPYLQPLTAVILPQIWEPRVLAEEKVIWMAKQLTTFVQSLALSGSTPFLHHALYRNYQPSAYQDSCSLSALYLLKTNQNHSILTSTIDAKIAALIASSSSWTLAEHLAAVQALIIYQIIRLFDSDLNLQSLASSQNSLLELWTAQLWKRSFNEVQSFPTSYTSWIFYESLRRTVLMSTFLRGTWSAVGNGGLCEVVPILARLPMTRDNKLWELDGESWGRRAREQQKRGCLIAYGEFTLSFRVEEEDVGSLPEFEKLLLVACRGEELRGW